MNPFYDPKLFKKAIFSKWCWIWLWIFPTYVAFEEMVVFYKKVFGKIYIVGMKTYSDLAENK